MKHTRVYAVSTLALLAGCLNPQPAPLTPTPPPDSIASSSVAASADQTWNALVEVFAERNIPITRVRSSEVAIAAAVISLPGRMGADWAQCGTSLGLPLPPDRATYHVLVGGNAVRSTSTVLVRFTASPRGQGETRRECVTRGVWERELQTAIRVRAEGPVVAAR